MRLQRPDVHTGFRVANVHHHPMPGFSFFFGCVLQGLAVDAHFNLLSLGATARNSSVRWCPDCRFQHYP